VRLLICTQPRFVALVSSFIYAHCSTITCGSLVSNAGQNECARLAELRVGRARARGARSGRGSGVFATLVILSAVSISSSLRDSHQAVSVPFASFSV
jgi:hypothetical protein